MNLIILYKMSILTEFKNDYSSFYYFLYNGMITNKLADSMDDLIGIQEKLFDFGLTMSGFQFVGLVLENSISNKPMYLKVAYFILSIGFVLSLFGSVLSYITFKFIRSIKNETPKFIEHSIIKYNKIFMMSYIVPFFNSILFMIPLNILIYNILDIYFGIIFNVFSGIVFISGIILHQIVIVKKQKYIIQDKIQLNNEIKKTTSIQRRLSDYIEEKKKVTL